MNTCLFCKKGTEAPHHLYDLYNAAVCEGCFAGWQRLVELMESSHRYIVYIPQAR